MGTAIVALTYVYILVVAYVFVIFTNHPSERGDMMINKAYNYAFSVLLFGFFTIWLLLELPHLVLDSTTAGYLLLASKLASVLTLGISLFVLRKKLC